MILNDNDMSISAPVGALNGYLAQADVAAGSTRRREAAARRCSARLPPLHELAKRVEEHVKGMVLPGTLFEEFGFNYIGPIDGHDLDALVPTLQNMRELERAAVPARGHEEGPGLQARRGRPDPLSRRRQVRSQRTASSAKARGKPTYTQVFGDWLCDMARAGRAARRHHAGDARRLGPGRVLERSSPTATSTSASPSSMR